MTHQNWAMWGIAVCASAAFGQTGPLVHEGIVEAPVADVWAAFTTKEGIESWMVPHGEIDLRVGGLMRTHYGADGVLGDPETIENTILSFEPQRMLSIKATKPPASFPHKDAIANMWSVIYFEPVDEARTRVRIVGLGYGEDEESQQLRAKFDWGNAYTLKKLQERFQEREQGAGSSEQGGEGADATMTLLHRLVGGEWIHEKTREDGKLFRVRNVLRLAPDGRSLICDGWQGNAEGMRYHAATQVWQEPGGSVRFQNIGEGGAIARGTIRATGIDCVEWDWRDQGPDGQELRCRITLSFTGPDAYRMRMYVPEPNGTESLAAEVDFRRVPEAPEEFRTPAQKTTETQRHRGSTEKK